MNRSVGGLSKEGEEEEHNRTYIQQTIDQVPERCLFPLVILLGQSQKLVAG